jgi:serine/threonine protein kinase/tetratricopeptide (TPR) repeat protein
MIGRTVSHYQILEEIGDGGMGVVYRAQDTKLKRAVALKFLPSEMTRDEGARSRFVYEAQTASALDHPNICTIYEVDETPDGRVFIAMAFYAGESLKQRLSRGPLPPLQAIDIAEQTAAGLGQVHRQGIIHRDIKPENLVVTENGVVKIVDFGVATLASLCPSADVWPSAGTVAYMSPEQATGDTVDQRSDIWSLGVVLYEMVTGKWPFSGVYNEVIIYSIVNLDPRPITAADEKLPAELERIVDKALVKKPADRYQSTDDMVNDLNALKAAVDAGGATVAVSKPPPLPSIAVLPFVNMSADPQQDYFCDGIAEDIINDLARITDLRVAARTSAFAFKGKRMDARDIGKALGVDVLLEGGVRKAGNRLRITTQLTNVTNGYHLWSDRFDRETSDVFAIQTEIAHNIARALEIKLSRDEREALAKTLTQDVVAYDFYLRGRKLFHQKRPGSIRQAIEMFGHAIAKDPNYALAHSGMADCYSYLSLFEDKEANLKRSFQAGQRALEIDPGLAEAHAARGLALSLSGRGRNEVDAEFETAIRLNPTLFEAYYFYGYSCRIQRRWEKAAELFEKAAVINPEDYQVQNHLGMAYKTLNLREKAVDAYRRSVLNIDRHLEMNPEDSRARQMGAVAHIELGDLEKGLEWGSQAVTMDPENPMLLYNSACVFSVAGEADRAIECLEKAIRTGYTNTGALLNDPDLDAIRTHPRFQSLVKRIR